MLELKIWIACQIIKSDFDPVYPWAKLMEITSSNYN